MGERYAVFPRTTTTIRPSQPDDPFPAAPRFSHRVQLSLDDEPTALPFQFTTIAAGPPPSRAFTPFAPELGYHVTAEDLNPDARLAKVYSPPYLHTNVSSMPGALGTLGTLLAHADSHDLGRLSSIAPHVYLQLFFPTGLRLESRAGRDLSFHDAFYPLDTGPLAVPDSGRWTEGLQIAVPADLNALSQIEGRFVVR